MADQIWSCDGTVMYGRDMRNYPHGVLLISGSLFNSSGTNSTLHLALNLVQNNSTAS